MIQQYRSVVTLLGRFVCCSWVLAGWLSLSCLLFDGVGQWSIVGHAVLGQDAAAKSPSGAQSGAQSGEKPTDQLKLQQTQLATQYANLEEVFLRMSEIEAATNPTRAGLLLQAAQMSKQLATQQRMMQASDLLGKGQYSRAIPEQEASRENLKKLLELLQSENRSSRVKDERKRLEDVLKDLRRIENIQRATRGRTEAGQDNQSAANDQKDLDKQLESAQNDLTEKSDGKKEEKSDGKKDEKSDGKGEPQSPKDQKGGEQRKSEQELKSGKDEKGKDDKSGEDKKSGGEPKAGEGQKSSEEMKTGEEKKAGEDKKVGEENKPGEENKAREEKKEGVEKESDPSMPKDASKDGQKDPSEGGDQEQNQEQSKEQSKDQGKEGSEGQKSEDRKPKTKEEQARQRVERARERMQKAEKELRDNNRKEAIEEQQKAEDELQQAIAELEKILKQLREEEIERTLVDLETRLKRMLEWERGIREQTQKLAELTGEDRDRQLDIQANKLSTEQLKVAMEGQRAMLLLKDEGSSQAFPEALEQVISDAQMVVKRLNGADVSAGTIAIEDEILGALDEMLQSLQEVQKKREEEKQNQQQGGGQSPGGGEQEEPLVGKIAELRLIKTLQLRVNRRTDRLADQSNNGDDLVGEVADEKLRDELRELSGRQQKIQGVTREILLEASKKQ
ncbi:MAG: hypothetical protein RL240_525 [Planctomycetota bacterium]